MMRRLRRTAAIGALTAGLMAGLTITAAAATSHASGASAYTMLADQAPMVAKDLWVGGQFAVTGAPILPAGSAPDGRLCGMSISCHPPVLATAVLSDDDPAPIAETWEQAAVTVECEVGPGTWFKIHLTVPGSRTEVAGWVAADAVDIDASSGRVFACTPDHQDVRAGR